MRRVSGLTDLEVHIFGPFEILHDTETVGLLVAPDTLEAGAVLERSEGVLPVPVSLVGFTFEHVATREANHGLYKFSARLNISRYEYLTGCSSARASAMSTRRPFLRSL